MRHGKKFNHLGRKKGHREAMLSNMANSLIMHKRIFTTVAKAKALRKYVEPLITKAISHKSGGSNIKVGFGFVSKGGYWQYAKTAFFRIIFNELP